MLAFSLENKKNENKDETEVQDPLQKEPNTALLNRNFKIPCNHLFCISDYFMGRLRHRGSERTPAAEDRARNGMSMPDSHPELEQLSLLTFLSSGLTPLKS